MEELPSIKLFGVKVTTSSEKEVLEYILKNLESKGKKPVTPARFAARQAGRLFITTPNPEIIMYALNHPEFKLKLNSANIALADGVGVPIAALLTGKGKLPRLTGTDLLEKLCSELSGLAQKGAKSPYSVGFFGGVGHVAEKTAECLQKKYSELKVSYASSDWDEKKIKGKKIDVLFVAMGFPKQENWIFENLDKIPVSVAMGVGGAFDYISETVSRAPKLIRTFGLEWLYRLIRQPWRIKRQLALISFTLLVFKEMFASRLSSKS